jgi:hypothetical protein
VELSRNILKEQKHPSSSLPTWGTEWTTDDDSAVTGFLDREKLFKYRLTIPAVTCVHVDGYRDSFGRPEMTVDDSPTTLEPPRFSPLLQHLVAGR